MVFWIIVLAANLIVGAFVGLTGVAGFLLPIVYTGPLDMGVTEGPVLVMPLLVVLGINIRTAVGIAVFSILVAVRKIFI